MRILFDHGTPAPLISFLVGHIVTKAKDAGWDRLVNGALLKAAEEAGFQVLVTTDKNMVAQQNLKSPAIAIVVLGNSQWRIVQRHVRKIAATVNAATPGSYTDSLQLRVCLKSPPSSRFAGQSRLRLGWRQSACHKVNHYYSDGRFARFGEILIVFAQASPTVEPAKGPFHDPTVR